MSSTGASDGSTSPKRMNDEELSSTSSSTASMTIGSDDSDMPSSDKERYGSKYSLVNLDVSVMVRYVSCAVKL